jgi:hypothetical protein
MKPLTGARSESKVHGQMISGPRNFDFLDKVGFTGNFYFFDLFFLTRKKFQLFILNSYGFSFLFASIQQKGVLQSPESIF